MILRKLSEKFLTIQLNIFQQIKYSKEGTFNALPETVFNVVKSTQNYSEFIPWCSSSSIVKPISQTQNFTQLTITFQKVKSLSYLSHVQIFGQNNPDQRYKIQSVCKEQPLKSLVSIWQINKNSVIEGESQKSVVNYSIEYEFSSPLLQLTSNLFLDYVGESMWVIFKEQAEKKQRQIEMNNTKSSPNNFDNLTFGKSSKYQEDPIKVGSFSRQNNLNQAQATNLSEYLGKHEKIHEIYCRNAEFKKKLDQWSKILYGTDNFQQKLQFKIKNYLIHKS